MLLVPKLIVLPSNLRYFSTLRRITKPPFRYYTSKLQNTVDDDNDKPIIYTKSRASQWQAKSSQMGTDSERLWYEPHVTLLSIGVFMIYFCILREESDIDQEFDETLYNRVKNLEETQLAVVLEYNLQHGLDTKAIEDRLKEIAKNKGQS